MFSDIIERCCNTKHKDVSIDYNITSDGDNSSCGDYIKLYLKTNNNIVEQASFEGYACSIATASADYMIDKIIGKNFDEIKRYNYLFNKMLCGNINEEEEKELGSLIDFAYISHMRHRINCAKLCWNTLMKGIDKCE